MRIVSLVPSITELIVDLGLEEQLFGITKFCVHPSHLRTTKTIVGGTKKIDHDRIAAINPTLIIANREENSREDVEALQEKYPVYLTDISDLPEALEMILAVGSRTSTEPRAREMVQQIRKEFDSLEEFLTPLDIRKVAYFIWRDPYMVAAGNTFINDLLRRAGFQNCFGELSRYPVIDLQQCLAVGCEELFLSTEPFPFSEKYKDEFHQALPQIPIRIVDGELFSWYGSRLLQAPSYFKRLASAVAGSD